MQLQLIKSERFGTIQTDFYNYDKKICMTANQLSQCLGYKNKDGMKKVIARHPYLKEKEFSCVVEVDTWEGGQNVPTSKKHFQETRLFNEDGIYEMAFLSYTDKAKEFRAWVRGILKSLRSGQATLIDTKQLETIKVKAQQDRAKAMLLNAQNRALKTLMSALPNDKLSPIAVEVFGLKSIEQVTGLDTGNYLPQCEVTYSATEVGKMLGISANKVGSIANKNSLKTDEYGIKVMDKSKYSSKEVPNFRYNQQGVEKIKKILKG